jgi:hypothetical protein
MREKNDVAVLAQIPAAPGHARLRPNYKPFVIFKYCISNLFQSLRRRKVAELRQYDPEPKHVLTMDPQHSLQEH